MQQRSDIKRRSEGGPVITIPGGDRPRLGEALRIALPDDDLVRLDEGRVVSIPGDERGSLREAQAPPTNLEAECSWCHLHKVGEPAPYPELCGVPDPDAKGSARRASDYQTATGDPVPKDPHAGKPANYGGGGTWHTPKYQAAIPGLKYRNGACHRKRGTRAFPLEGRVKKLMQGDGACPILERLDMEERVPARLRRGGRVPLPDRATSLIQAQYKNRQFLRYIEDGMTLIEAGQEVFGQKSPQTFYSVKHRLDDVGGPGELFIREAIKLFEVKDFPWGNKIQNGHWARAFFTTLVGGPVRLSHLASLCLTDAKRRITIRQAAAIGDMAKVQTILFSEHSGLFDGKGASFAAERKAMQARARVLSTEDEDDDGGAGDRGDDILDDPGDRNEERGYDRDYVSDYDFDGRD